MSKVVVPGSATRELMRRHAASDAWFSRLDNKYSYGETVVQRVSRWIKYSEREGFLDHPDNIY